MRRLTIQEFIDKAIKIHNNIYEYSLVEFKDTRTKVNIICPTHGIFEQTPNNHLKGTGCPNCATVRLVNILRKSTNDFISKATPVHGDLYDYSLVTYESWDTKIKIICPTHGIFEQRPYNHLRGNGCPKCTTERTIYSLFTKYKATPTQFYIIKYKGLYKVGITTQDVSTRYAKELTDDSKIETLFIKYFSNYKDAYEHEQLIIKLNQKYKYSGEPIFKITGNTEVFTDLWKESFI